jgi:hypothetical protein
LSVDALSDHDILVEMHTLLKGYNGQVGLVQKVDDLESLLRGDPTAENTALKLGLMGLMEMQRVERRNIVRVVKAIAGVLASLIGYIALRMLGR